MQRELDNGELPLARLQGGIALSPVAHALSSTAHGAGPAAVNAPIAVKTNSEQQCNDRCDMVTKAVQPMSGAAQRQDSALTRLPRPRPGDISAVLGEQVGPLRPVLSCTIAPTFPAGMPSEEGGGGGCLLRCALLRCAAPRCANHCPEAGESPQARPCALKSPHTRILSPFRSCVHQPQKP